MGTRPKLIRYKEPLKSILEKTAQGLSEAGRLRLARWLATFLAAWFGLRLLHSYEGRAYTETVPPKEGSPPDAEPQTVRFAGRTMDLTLFAVTRALDVVVGDVWARHKVRRLASTKWTKSTYSIPAKTFADTHLRVLITLVSGSRCRSPA
jgi:hypothetical protein